MTGPWGGWAPRKTTSIGARKDFWLGMGSQQAKPWVPWLGIGWQERLERESGVRDRREGGERVGTQQSGDNKPHL